jgi:hypothetical protein
LKARFAKEKSRREYRAPTPIEFTTGIIEDICRIAGSPALLDEVRLSPQGLQLRRAVEAHDTPVLFNWLLDEFSMQGISDYVARVYLAKHGNATWTDIERRLSAKPPCPLLKNFWSYDGCNYHKQSGCCTEPDHIDLCPVPTHRLRNGRLNQTAYSLFLFVRDIAKSELVAWMDHQIAATELKHGESDLLDQALIRPMSGIYGVSDKVLTMSLSGILLSSDRPNWVALGAQATVIDTLVHNLLHRTGILDRFGAQHQFGTSCYKPGHCADIIRLAASRIDARQFNPGFPARFTRFVQHAIWAFCAMDGLNICNGNQIDDRRPCQNQTCQVFGQCGRKTLKT